MVERTGTRRRRKPREDDFDTLPEDVVQWRQAGCPNFPIPWSLLLRPHDKSWAAKLLELEPALADRQELKFIFAEGVAP